jgi:hypothetical protein
MSLDQAREQLARLLGPHYSFEEVFDVLLAASEAIPEKDLREMPEYAEVMGRYRNDFKRYRNLISMTSEIGMARRNGSCDCGDRFFNGNDR